MKPRGLLHPAGSPGVGSDGSSTTLLIVGATICNCRNLVLGWNTAYSAVVPSAGLEFDWKPPRVPYRCADPSRLGDA